MGGGGGDISGSGSKFNCASRVRSGQMILGTGFNFKPVQTSRRAVSDPLPEPFLNAETF